MISKAVRTVRWSSEPEMLEFMKATDKGQPTAELSELFNQRFGFPLSKQQISLFRCTYGYQTYKGHQNQKRVPIGTERILKRGKVDEYIIVKVAEEPTKPLSKDNWKMKHVLIWEQSHNMDLPKGMVVMFADRNRSNYDPDNLVAVPKQLCGLLNAHFTNWHDKESLELCVAQAQLKIATTDKLLQLKRTCETCGKQFTVKRCSARDVPNTCPECVAKGHRNPHEHAKGTRTCAVCGKEFTYYRKTDRRCQECVAEHPKHAVDRHIAIYDRG